MDVEVSYGLRTKSNCALLVELQIENKKILLERQYITLLEQRVAELQKLVKPSKEEDNVCHLAPPASCFEMHKMCQTAKGIS